MKSNGTEHKRKAKIRWPPVYSKSEKVEDKIKITTKTQQKENKKPGRSIINENKAGFY